jgi:hypothetical protein
MMKRAGLSTPACFVIPGWGLWLPGICPKSLLILRLIVATICETVHKLGVRATLGITSQLRHRSARHAADLLGIDWEVMMIKETTDHSTAHFSS